MKPEVRISGPNHLLKYIKEGKPSVIPFYVNHILKVKNPALRQVNNSKK